jgi:hypothetical protein
MVNDSNWTDEVRRWFEAGKLPRQGDAARLEDGFELGYEAAYPALQARHWPDAPSETDEGR